MLVPLSLLAAALALFVPDLSPLQPLYAWVFGAVYGLLDAFAWERTLWRLEGAIPGLFLMAGIALLPLRFWVLLPLGAALLWWSEARHPDAPSLTVFGRRPGQLRAGALGGDYRLLYDTGTERMARRAVLPALRTLGVRRLDALILSHDDDDHLRRARRHRRADAARARLRRRGAGRRPALRRGRRRAVPGRRYSVARDLARPRRGRAMNPPA